MPWHSGPINSKVTFPGLSAGLVYHFRHYLEDKNLRYDVYEVPNILVGDIAKCQVLCYCTRNKYVGNLYFSSVPSLSEVTKKHKLWERSYRG